MIAYLDASALIYLIEGARPFGARVREQLGKLGKQFSPLQLALGELSRLECRIGPLRAGDAHVLASYDTFFSRADLIVVQLTREVVDLATVIRAERNLKTPDALQAACCLQLGAKHIFVTGDRGFSRVAGLNVQIVG